MRPQPFADMQCSIARALDVVGSWWSLLIIRDAMLGASRFKHFEKSLGISKNTLTSRLNHLVATGVLAKRAAPDGSAYEQYELTEMGRELAPILLSLAQWGDRWHAHEKGPTFAVIDEATRQEISTIWPRRENGERIDLTKLYFRPLREAAHTADAKPLGGSR